MEGRMARRRYELTDREWLIIESLLPNKPRGVPRVDDRRVLNGILWRFRSGAPWAEIPERYGPSTRGSAPKVGPTSEQCNYLDVLEREGDDAVLIGADRDHRPVLGSKQIQWLGRNLPGSRFQRPSTHSSPQRQPNWLGRQVSNFLKSLKSRGAPRKPLSAGEIKFQLTPWLTLATIERSG
jgi:hypothetical protein